MGKKIEDTSWIRKRNKGGKMYGEKEWLKVKQLVKQGLSFREIGRRMRIDRQVVSKLAVLKEPPRAKPRQRGSILDPHKGTIREWLKDAPRMKATDIRRKLGYLGYRGSYSTVKRYVCRQKEKIRQKATIRFESLPGKQAQVDFGEVKVKYADRTEEMVNVYIFVMGFSRYKVADITETQKRKELMKRIEDTFHHIGGIPEELLFDNLKPVAKTARTFKRDGELSQEWDKFASYYGFKTSLAMVARGQTKGKVERPIEPIKRFIRTSTFLCRQHLRKELQKFLNKVNNTKHSTTREEPAQRLCKEKNFLMELPSTPIGLPEIVFRKVSSDCMVSVEGIGYSVGKDHVGQEVEVRILENEIQIFSKKGHLIDAHTKIKGKDKEKYSYSVKKEHYIGLPGVDRAFRDFNILNEMGYGPFYVQKRSLKEYCI